MSRFFTSSALAACLFWLLLNAPVSAGEKDVVEYRHVETLLRRHCYRCHNDSKQEGGLNLTRRQAVFGQADSLESIVVPGKPKASLLIARVSDHDYGDISARRRALKPQQIQTLSDWIDRSDLARASPAIHWAYQPVSRPNVPAINQRQCNDAFIHRS
ncbi:MAG: c-type cytochrome domain-containing protein [Rubinisphaera brasiliensis]|uniref:c-type cytochrome domain-containing protein n=1 Tax=Rubinisphaera brasiliensis TaxID=119 RepID=UPI00391CED01